MRVSPSLVFLFAFSALAVGRTIHVDAAAGNDEWTGASGKPSGQEGPLKTIQRAVDQAQPGDMIFLAPGSGPYREEVMIKKVSGMPGSPITLEGSGCTVDVGVDVSEGPWESDGDRWILNSDLRYDPHAKGLNQRALANFRGQPMYHDSKKTSLTEAGSVGVDESGRLTFHFTENLKPPFRGLVVPRLYTICGVAIQGSSYWHIKNLHARGAGNDGFNLHGRGEGIVIENCSAMFSGDEGISSHDTIHAEVKDCLFAFNASSVTDINRSVTSYANCIAAFNDSPGYRLVGEGGSYILKDSLSAANRRVEVESDLPNWLVKVENLTTLPREPGVKEKIRAWNPQHPQMKVLFDMIETLSNQGKNW
jgi:hypothetical protein